MQTSPTGLLAKCRVSRQKKFLRTRSTGAARPRWTALGVRHQFGKPFIQSPLPQPPAHSPGSARMHGQAPGLGTAAAMPARMTAAGILPIALVAGLGRVMREKPDDEISHDSGYFP